MTQTSRSTIGRAIRSGKLSARRDDAGEWRIDPSELARVFEYDPATDPDQTRPMTHGDPVVDPDQSADQSRPMTHGDPGQYRVKAAAYRQIAKERTKQLDQANATIEDLRQRLNAAGRRNDQLLALLPAPDAVTVLPWWRRLIG